MIERVETMRQGMEPEGDIPALCQALRLTDRFLAPICTAGDGTRHTGPLERDCVTDIRETAKTPVPFFNRSPYDGPITRAVASRALKRLA